MFSCFLLLVVSGKIKRGMPRGALDGSVFIPFACFFSSHLLYAFFCSDIFFRSMLLAVAYLTFILS